MTEIVFSTATELAARIRDRQLSAVDVLDAYLEQIARRNPELNAVVTLDAERARAQASAADAALGSGEVWGPLHGVPFTVKDAIATVGMRTTGGYEPLRDHVPSADATVVARLKAAGAILMGKTNLPVLSGDYQSDNPIFGRTNNPWNLDHVPGGSSGGSAAAIAGGLSALEIGSDYSGSIRIPAHFCGVYGLRPTEHRVPLTGHIPPLPGVPRSVRHVNTIGPLTRSVDDLELALRVIAGPDGQDWDVPPVGLESAPDKPLSDWRIAWTDDFAGLSVSQDTQVALARLATDLAALGGPVEYRAPADAGFRFEDAWETIFELGALEAAGGIASHKESALGIDQATPEQINDPTMRGYKRGRRGDLATYHAALARRDRLQAALGRFFADWDVLLCPVAVGPAIPHCSTGTPVTVDDRTVTYWVAGVGYTCPFSVPGFPAVVVPFVRSSEGLPIGLQIVGPRWSEPRLFAIARRIGEVTGGFQRPAGY